MKHYHLMQAAILLANATRFAEFAQDFPLCMMFILSAAYWHERQAALVSSC